MSFDRILVLDNKGNGGEVVEYASLQSRLRGLFTNEHPFPRFDTPAELLRREGGVLYQLAKRSGEYSELLRFATQDE